MASYTLNEKAVAHARKLIENTQYALDSDWGPVLPKLEDALERHLGARSKATKVEGGGREACGVCGGADAPQVACGVY